MLHRISIPAVYAAIMTHILTDILWFAAFAAVFFVMMRFGCGSHAMHGAGQPAAGPPADPPFDPLGQEQPKIDPVCKMVVQPYTGVSAYREGTLYRFCSVRCLETFQEYPAAYSQPAMIEGQKKES